MYNFISIGMSFKVGNFIPINQYVGNKVLKFNILHATASILLRGKDIYF